MQRSNVSGVRVHLDGLTTLVSQYGGIESPKLFEEVRGLLHWYCFQSVFTITIAS